MLNSASLERIEALGVAAQLNGPVVVTAAGESGMPTGAEERVLNASRMVEASLKAGIPFGPDLCRPPRFPIAVDSEYGRHCLDAIAELRRRFGTEIHITGGMSNVSFGLPNRRLLNDAFLILAIEAGADSGIVDPTVVNVQRALAADRTTRPFQLAFDVFTGADENCRAYMKAYRAGELTPSRPDCPVFLNCYLICSRWGLMDTVREEGPADRRPSRQSAEGSVSTMVGDVLFVCNGRSRPWSSSRMTRRRGQPRPRCRSPSRSTSWAPSCSPSVNLTPARRCPRGRRSGAGRSRRASPRVPGSRERRVLSGVLGLGVHDLAHGLAQQVDRGRAEGVEAEGEGGVLGEQARGRLLHGGPDGADGSTTARAACRCSATSGPERWPRPSRRRS